MPQLTVYKKKGHGRTVVKNVKSLAWLLRHAKDVVSITFIEGYNNNTLRVSGQNEDDYWLYITSWADKSVFTKWVNRPSLKHITPTYIKATLD